MTQRKHILSHLGGVPFDCTKVLQRVHIIVHGDGGNCQITAVIIGYETRKRVSDEWRKTNPSASEYVQTEFV